MKGVFAWFAGLAAALCVFPSGVGCTGARETAAPGAGSLADAGPRCTQILAANYDQSCSADSDCTTIVEGNACSACSLVNCVNATISVAALASYDSDIAGTPGLVGIGDGGCPGCRSTVSLSTDFGPYCCGGKCQIGSACSGPAGADANGADGADDDGPYAQNLMGGYLGASCTSGASCASGQCVFPIAGGCDSLGQCFFPYLSEPECGAIEGLCACDGTMTTSLPCSSWAVAPTPATPSYGCFGTGGDGAVDASPDVVDGSIAPTGADAD